MENASKALIMAGSILMALMVIGTLMFMYNKLVDFEQTKTDSDEVTKQAKYMKDIEAYSKNIYGSELLSLANLLVDYRLNQAELKGYTPITVEVNLKTEILDKDGRVILSGDSASPETHTISQITSGIREVKEQIEDYESIKYEDTGKTVKQFSQMTNREIAKAFGIDITAFRNMQDYDIRYEIDDVSGIADLYDEIDKYITLKTTETQFKSTIFILKEEKYDDIGRIKSMTFEEYKEVIDF